MYLCPVKALQALLRSKPFPPTAPPFANLDPHIGQAIDANVRDALKTGLKNLNFPTQWHDFHIF